MLVEKIDRLYRNLKDWVTVDELDVELHFPKEGIVLSRESRSSKKFRPSGIGIPFASRLAALPHKSLRAAGESRRLFLLQGPAVQLAGCEPKRQATWARGRSAPQPQSSRRANSKLQASQPIVHREAT
jgi:hypothetical protein